MLTRAKSVVLDVLKPQIDAVTWYRHRLTRRYFVRGDIDVLDVGTGGGLETLELLRRGNRVTAVELDGEAAQRTLERIVRHGFASRGKVLELHVRDLPLTGAYDEVVMCEVLEHVAEDGAVLDAIAAVLKPGGRLVLSTPTALWGQLPGDTVSRTEDGGHVRAGYQGPELDEMLRQRGFVTIHRRLNSNALLQWECTVERCFRRGLLWPLAVLTSLLSRPFMALVDCIPWRPSDQITIAVKLSARDGRNGSGPGA